MLFARTVSYTVMLSGSRPLVKVYRKRYASQSWGEELAAMAGV